MNYRQLGNTGLMVSEVGIGGEWFERHTREEVQSLLDTARNLGINILDCWMSNPAVRSAIGDAIQDCRAHWIIQGHIGSTWQDGQYVRTREMDKVVPAFEDLLQRMHTDYIDLGMIHYVDDVKDWENLKQNGFLDYVQELKAAGRIRHIGLSTHNARIGKLAVESGIVEMMLFSLNPAFDFMPQEEDVDAYFENLDSKLQGLDPERAAFYRLAEEKGVGLTVMKGFAGGRLLSQAQSPFGVALTPLQCIHYCLTRPAVAAVMAGMETVEQILEATRYSDASEEEKDYASVLAGAPKHAFSGQCTYCGHCSPCPMNIDIALVNKFYDLAAMQPEVPASVKAHYEALESTAADCIGCRSCEERCPFGVKIAERMELARELFA